MFQHSQMHNVCKNLKKKSYYTYVFRAVALSIDAYLHIQAKLYVQVLINVKNDTRTTANVN